MASSLSRRSRHSWTLHFVPLVGYVSTVPEGGPAVLRTLWEGVESMVDRLLERGCQVEVSYSSWLEETFVGAYQEDVCEGSSVVELMRQLVRALATVEKAPRAVEMMRLRFRVEGRLVLLRYAAAPEEECQVEELSYLVKRLE